MGTKRCECSKWSQGFVCFEHCESPPTSLISFILQLPFIFILSACFHSTSSFDSSKEGLPIKLEDLRVWWWTLTVKRCDPIRLHHLKHKAACRHRSLQKRLCSIILITNYIWQNESMKVKTIPDDGVSQSEQLWADVCRSEGSPWAVTSWRSAALQPDLHWTFVLILMRINN